MGPDAAHWQDNQCQGLRFHEKFFPNLCLELSATIWPGPAVATGSEGEDTMAATASTAEEDPDGGDDALQASPVRGMAACSTMAVSVLG